MKDCYLKYDVLLLADAFENFWNESINSFELDTAHYFPSPGYSYDAVLKVFGVSLKLISDIEKY